ncbi:tetratricopeptide repeat protein [Streptacidiphilus sp. PB12-B1b]|uniref:tetratricopeptide repeat protein n=1 Tax=Streptacidiphilus sp. PB12-B1b TaxID=2705012 RepID=UPI0015F81D36|nr:tetratricopeptide repeat protein [Streptacidiphilus sp. PB12-B1b]QMU78475.1 tetratricopeptide repeat protein [Streptacidiphilus sp. PB12-B1b]
MAAAQTARQFGAALPPAPPYFAGRQTELARLREEVDRPAFAARGGEPGDGPDASATRVLVVAGRPGSGRTSLALRFAHDIAADYPDGQFFVRLGEPGGGPVPAGRIARRLLAALGEPPARRPLAGHDSAADADADAEHPDCAALRSALSGRRALLLLDDVRTSDQLAALLPQAPGCLVVAVTAGPLTGIADARPCVLGGLDVRTALALITSLAGDTRIVCDPVAARGLVEGLACHPAALRLVGGWLRTRPGASVADARQLLAETPQRVSLLKQPGAALRDTDPLRRAFDLVYEGLTAPAARLLRLLTIAPDGRAEPRTAAALLGCPVDTAAGHLAALAEQQLLNPRVPARTHPDAGTDAGAVGADADPGAAAAARAAEHAGYELPEALRAPLAGLLAADRTAETELARARMLERLVRLLTACVHRIAPGSGPEPEPLPASMRFATAADAWRWLDDELPVLRAAVRIALADGGLDGLAMRLATTLVRALPLWAGGAQPVAADLYELHGAILELAARGGRARQQAAALVNLGDLHARAGEHARALERYRAALGPARAVDDQIAVGRILEAVAGAYRASGDLVRAADWYGRALALRRSRGERAEELRLLGRLAAVHTAQGRFGEALRDYRAAVGLHRKLGDGLGAVAALLGVARAQELSGSTEQALRTQREALAAARALDDGRTGARLQAQVLVRMAEALERAGDPAGARAQREQAVALGLPATRAGGAAEAAGAVAAGVRAEVTPPGSE